MQGLRSLRIPLSQSTAARSLGRTPFSTAPPPKDTYTLFDDLKRPSSSPPKAPSGSFPIEGPPRANPITLANDSSAKANKYAIPLKPRYRLHCQSTQNNTIVTFTNPKGDVISWFSGGSCKFKGANRNSYEAGYQCAVRAFKSVEAKMDPLVPKSEPELELEVLFKGFGQGRDALQRALMSTEGENVRPRVVMMTDRTAIKFGGTRAKKARRL